MKRSHWFGLAALAIALVAVPSWVSAQEAAPTGPSPEAAEMEYQLPAEFDDPAFGQYVDITLLEPAWTNKDADLLVDVALQLAEGQKVLMRPHKAGSAEDLMKLAAAIATRKGNKDAIDRIEKAAKAHNFESVAAAASNAAKLAAAPRKAEPGLTVQLDQANLGDIADYGLLLDEVHGAELLRNGALLDELKGHVDKAQYLSVSQKSYLAKVIGDARSAVGDDDKPSDNSIAATIDKLQAESRHHGGHGHGHGHGHWGHGGHGHWGHGGHGHWGHGGHGHWGHGGHGHWGHGGHGHWGHGGGHWGHGGGHWGGHGHHD